MLFDLKTITFLGRKVRILLQNENGPCPLLAIANVLLLQNRITIHEDKACMSLSDVVSEVAEVIVEQTSKMAANTQTRQQLLDSVLNILPRLAKGLDLNVRFTGVTAYEFTEEVTVFDALDLPLVHGWVLDTQDRPAAEAVGTNSYNHLMYKLVEYRSLLDRLAAAPTEKHGVDAGAGSKDDDHEKPSDYVLVSPSDGKEEHDGNSKDVDRGAGGKDGGGHEDDTDDAKAGAKRGVVASPEKLAPSKDDVRGSSSSTGAKGCKGGESSQLSADEAELLRQGPVIETFLAETSSQLTYVGLLALYQHVRERQLAIFFRNDHFSTMFSFGGQLFLLVTDLGYQREPSVVWELLDEIDGDTEYVDGSFAKARPLSFASPDLVLVPDTRAASSPSSPAAAAAPGGTIAQRSEGDGRGGEGTRVAASAHDDVDADLLLALQLQDEEEAAARDIRHSAAARAGSSGSSVSSSSAVRGATDRDYIASQYTPEQLDYMRAQELQYEEYAASAQAAGRANPAGVPPPPVSGGARGAGASAAPPPAAATATAAPPRRMMPQRRTGAGESTSNCTVS